MSTSVKNTNMSTKQIQALQERIRLLEEENKALVSKIPKQAKKVYPLNIRYVIEIHKDVTDTSLAKAKGQINPEISEMNKLINNIIKEQGWTIRIGKDKTGNKIPIFKAALFKKKKEKAKTTK
jgi:hypothetical protein